MCAVGGGLGAQCYREEELGGRLLFSSPSSYQMNACSVQLQVSFKTGVLEWIIQFSTVLISVSVGRDLFEREGRRGVLGLGTLPSHTGLTSLHLHVVFVTEFSPSEHLQL